jgi:GNAT superfamily N-acetyltransferase
LLSASSFSTCSAADRASAPLADALSFRDLDVDRDCELLDRFHREVLRASFSADELDDVRTLASGLRGGGAAQSLVSVALGGDGDVLGGIVGEVYAPERVLLLAYLAVRPDLRGHGVGTALLEYVRPRWYANPAIRLAVAEVHDPRRWSGIAGEDPVSRLRFYGRFGARVLGVPFVQPALAAGRTRIEGFLLLAFHVDPAVAVDDGCALPSDLLSRFVRRYYEATEGAHPPYDPELTGLLRVIEERPAIELLPVTGYERVPLLAP